MVFVRKNGVIVKNKFMPIMVYGGHCFPSGLKRIVILVFEYSFGFQMNIPNILFTRISGNMAILSDKVTIILVEWWLLLPL